MILNENRKQQAAPDPNQWTISTSDMKMEDQPPDVFQRQWTPVQEDNPVWRAYSAMLRGSKESSQNSKRPLSACKNCFTLFLPTFPEDDFHLHKPSVNFRTAIHKKAIRYCDERCLNEADSSKKLEKSFQYRALIGLAQEAGAFKREQGVDYIKLIRVVRGVRHHRERPSFEPTEVCENADVEQPVAEVSEEKLMIEQLAMEILDIINQ